MSAQAFALLIVSAAVGYGIAKFFAGKKENTQGRLPCRLPSIIFYVKGYTVHLHHWIWASIIFAVFLFMRLGNSIVFGLFAGAILQGLHYRDRLKIIYKA